MPAFQQGRTVRPEYRPENFGRDTRYLDYWRVYVYVNKLHSLPGSNVRGFRNMRPSEYRFNYVEQERMLAFANRDLSVLLFNKKADLLILRQDVFPNLLISCNMKSMDFRFALAPFLGNKTNHFVSELINYARSPYDDPFCYELNVKYTSDVPVDGALQHSFVEFSKRIDVDEFESDMLNPNPFFEIDDLGDEGFRGFPDDQDTGPLLESPSSQLTLTQADIEELRSVGASELTRMVNVGAAARGAAGAADAQAPQTAAAAPNGGVAAGGAAAATAGQPNPAIVQAQLMQAQTVAALAARRLSQHQQRLTSIANITNNIRLARKRERRLKLINSQRPQ